MVCSKWAVYRELLFKMTIGLLVTVFPSFPFIFFPFSKGIVNIHYDYIQAAEYKLKNVVQKSLCKGQGKISWLFLIFTIYQGNIPLDKKAL